MKEILKHIEESFNNRIRIVEKRPEVYQLLLPLYHEDGDMIDLFISRKGKDEYRLCDFGLTLMRLSYSYEIDTPNKESIYEKILMENQLVEEEGNLCFSTNKHSIFTDILHVAQAYAKIGSMRYFKREVIESLFYEMIDDFVEKNLQSFNPKKSVLPIPERDDLETDFEFRPNGYPVYLFAVKDVSKARLATISCLEYERSNIKFRSLVVHEDFEKLPKKDRSRLTNACDKQFTSLEDFKANAIKFLEREK